MVVHMGARRSWWTLRVEEAVGRLEAASVGFFALVTTAQSEQAGVSNRVRLKLVACGRWVRLQPGVFAVASLDGGPLQRCAAALLAGDLAFLQLTSGALAFGGLDLDPTTEPRLAVPLTASGRVWPRRSVAPQRITVVQRLRTTDPRQTRHEARAAVGEPPRDALPPARSRCGNARP
jgi:hypothetical protein